MRRLRKKLSIRLNEFDVAAIVFKSFGDPGRVMAYEHFLDANKDHWLVREIRHFWKRVLKRVDLTSRSLVTLIEPGSCFAGTLAELAAVRERLTARNALVGASDHRVSKSLYAKDPSGIEFEVMWRVPAEDWAQETADGSMIGPLDLEAEIARWGDRVTGAAAGSVT